MASRGKGKRDRQEDTKVKQTATVEGEPLKINKWDSAAVKNALDDTAKKIMMEEYGCVEDFTIIDMRLALCTIACSFSAFALVYDYINPFPKSGTVLATCAISYFVLMGILYLYAMFVEGTVFMRARKKDPAGVVADSVWTLSSSLPRFGHDYTLSVEYSTGQGNSKGSENFKKPVTSWIDEEGSIVFDKFCTDFKQLCEAAQAVKKTQ